MDGNNHSKNFVMEEILSSLPFWEEMEETKILVQNYHPNLDFPF